MAYVREDLDATYKMAQLQSGMEQLQSGGESSDSGVLAGLDEFIASANESIADAEITTLAALLGYIMDVIMTPSLPDDSGGGGLA